MRFYIGLHQPAHAARFERCMISVNRLWTRQAPVPSREWIMDSGAFSLLNRPDWPKQRAGYTERYAEQIARWAELSRGTLVAAVTPDWMCEPVMLARTRQSARAHAGLSIHSFITLREAFGRRPPVHLMPVLQGWTPEDYVWCIEQMGSNLGRRVDAPLGTMGDAAYHWGLPGECLLPRGSWVGVGSVCKRNGDPRAIEDVLLAIHSVRPDLRLHGFGIKLTALASDVVRSLLYSADSMAWSWSARRQGRDGNSPTEAARYVARVEGQEWQRDLFTPRRLSA